jgi:uncharacterized Tic20 family protein
MEVLMDDMPPMEERLMAALSHAAVIVSGPGILVGVIVWLTQREKSPFASRQGLQAAVYQIVGMIVIIALWILWGIFYFLSMIPLIIASNQNQDPPLIFFIGLGAMLIPFAFMIAWALYGLWGALMTLQGRDFSYAFIGRLLQNGQAKPSVVA